MDIYGDPKLDKFLLLVYKYSMELIERDIIQYLGKCKSVRDATSLMVVSQIIKSAPLYEKAKKALIDGQADLTLQDAKRIGIESAYEIIMARSKIILQRVYKCPSCISDDFRRPTEVQCLSCGDLYVSYSED
jgi:hypothetical protein